jgi:hypothetical protein
MKRIRLDDLLGTKVRDARGRVIGRIFEMRAEGSGHKLFIVEYYLGPAALLTRVGISLLTLVGFTAPEPRKIPWNELDISDTTMPKLLGEQT